MTSKLLDMRDCDDGSFGAIYDEMLRLSLAQQPGWLRPLLVRSATLKRWTGYDHWSRAWEYPWAILAADLRGEPLRTLDVGGGGSSFALYLARSGHDSTLVDPSLDQGSGFVFDPQKSLYRNARSLTKRALFKVAGIHSLWGLPERNGSTPVHHHPFSADRLEFPDRRFDRVFCLSVMEHIPAGIWPKCMAEFERVLRPGGRLVITLDMTTPQANDRLYRRLLEACSLRLIGDPDYEVPMNPEEQRIRHPGHGYETIGLVWAK
jgi:SAM-dependent methyltransferase